MKIKFAIMALAASTLMISACGSSEDTATGPQSPALEKVAAPAGKAWSDIVVKTPAGGFLMGNPNAKLQLLEYGAITCPTCAKFSEDSSADLKQMINTGVVAMEYRPYLVHGVQDLPGFLLAQCNGPESFFALSDQLYADQANWLGKMQTITEAEAAALQSQPPVQQISFLANKMGLVDFVKERGVSEDAAKQCLADPKALDAMVKTTENGSKNDDVSGTPSLFLNGKRLEMSAWEPVKIALKNAGAR
jgi:protein-disulfide isomerase